MYIGAASVPRKAGDDPNKQDEKSYKNGEFYGSMTQHFLS